MAKVTYDEALKYQAEAAPIAQKLYETNSDYKKFVIAYHIQEKCGLEVKNEARKKFNLTPGQTNVLFYSVTGFWNFNNGIVPYPTSDEAYINLYYVQRCYLAMRLLSQKVYDSPQADLYRKLVDLQGKIREYNSTSYGREVIGDGPAFVKSVYTDYRTSKETLIAALGMITPPNRNRYVYVAKQDSKAKDLALAIKKDPIEFCEWNKIKTPEGIVPKGYVYFGGIKK